MTENSSFDVSDRNRVARLPKRGAYDRETIYAIVDAALIVQVGFVANLGLSVIPMFHARQGDQLLFHGSTKSRLMQQLACSSELCISAAIVDGIVLAKSLFHHSMNYRSVTLFGAGQAIEGEAEKLQALRTMTDKIAPGRWDDARHPNQQELKATLVAAVKIDSASAKIRSGGPIDDDEDLELDHWSGVIPVISQMGEAVADQHSVRLPVPDYIGQLQNEFNNSSERTNDQMGPD